MKRYNFYYWLYIKAVSRKAKDVHTERRIVCDHLGVIDTLGFERVSSPRTRKYSDELAYITAVRIMGFWFCAVDCCGDKIAYITREQPEF